MAGVTSDDALAAEIRLIYPAHHQDHLPRRCLFLRSVGVPGPIAARFLGMAIDAIHIKRSGEEPHGFQELAHRDAAKQLHVLENVFGRLRVLLWFTLGLCPGSSEATRKQN